MSSVSPSRPSLFPLLLIFCLTAGLAAGIGTRFYFTHSGSKTALFGVIDPLGQFPEVNPGQRLNILVMGIDDNWTQRDISYTTGARSDTLLVASLDLTHHKAYILSIPRDTRIRIAGTEHTGKINGAFASGGAPRAMRTVEQFLGVPISHYIVLKIDATKKLVDALGGVDVNVEKDMNYDDNWGHLHIHLKKGLQHLDGDQAVGYIRFRHDREGDLGRIRRQQQLLHCITGALKSPMVLGRLGSLEATFRQSVLTDLQDNQIAALAEIFKKTSPSQIISSYVPGTDERLNGIWFLVPDEAKKRLLVDWLLKGRADAEIPLVRVLVQDGCGKATATRYVIDRLRTLGFEAQDGGPADRSDYANTVVVDYDRLKGAGALVASKLRLATAPIIQPDAQAGTCVQVIVGQDLVNAALASSAAN